MLTAHHCTTLFYNLIHIIPRSRMDAQSSQHRVSWTRKTQVQTQLLTQPQRAPLLTKITRGLEHWRIVGDIKGKRMFVKIAKKDHLKGKLKLCLSWICHVQETKGICEVSLSMIRVFFLFCDVYISQIFFKFMKFIKLNCSEVDWSRFEMLFSTSIPLCK